jgi:hypothetical protein
MRGSNGRLRRSAQQVGKAGGKLQRKLHCKAKSEPDFRFYVRVESQAIHAAPSP